MPATSKTIICKQGLAMVGYNGILSDVDNDQTPAANACRLFFDSIRDVVLEARPWPFATRRWKLQDIGIEGTLYEGEYLYRYKKPADCILGVALLDKNGGRRLGIRHNPLVAQQYAHQLRKPPFRIVDQETEYGQAIICDLEDAIIEGNVRVEEVNLFSSTFNHALAMGIAAHAGMAIRCDAKMVAGAQSQFTNWLAAAASLAQNEQQDDPQPESEYVSVRG